MESLFVLILQHSPAAIRWLSGLMVILLLAWRPAYAIDIPFLSSHIPYEIELQGNDSLKDQIIEDLEGQRSENLTLKNYKDPRKIARFEQGIIERTLRSQGYYSGTVTVTLVKESVAEESSGGLSGQANTGELQPGDSQITDFIYQVEPGNRFFIKEVNFEFPSEVDIEKLRELSVRPGQPFVAAKVLENVEFLKKAVLDSYCFYKVNVSYEAYIEPGKYQAGVTFKMADSPQVNIGHIGISGQESITDEYLYSKLSLEEGQCFKRRKVDQAKLNLLKTNLIGSADTRIGVPEEGKVDVEFNVQERFHRTIKAGVGYSTDEGPNISLGWEHRNILNGGQKLDISSRFSEVRQNVNGEFEVPAFGSPDNRLIMEASVSNEELDSYDSETILAGMRLEHRFSEHWLGSAGTRFKYSLVNDTGVTEEFGLLSFPFQLKWETTDDLLNPTRGWSVIGNVSPYLDMLDQEINFVKSSASGSIYFTFDTWLRPTLAMRASAGSISGVGNRDLPADERFYVGGGGSVRGYPYQTLSTIEDDDPVGGSSFQEVSVETRFRIGENWGLVTFLDGGYAFEDASQDVQQELRWGTGIGIRYYTLFAPIRADVGIPLNKRESVDDDFQLYISIGQAF
ncbi:autotransporter assembly complex protein TamA [Hahella ganghwensis]|uniref:autotransporter assembly complex protein TamA n=1 Tax=Hahella ganghwensis TaxID=286420 RepID=UPI00036082D8|nr:BamA/TamA family outer membrane protein [Hahella ganghwensis]